MSKNQKKLIQIIITILITIVVFIIDLLVKNIYIEIALYLVCYLVIAYSVIKKAIRNVFKGQLLDENFLMLIASVGAFILGEYIEGIAVMLFYQIGELFESYAVKKSRKDITALMNIKATYANKVLSDLSVITVDPNSLEIDDIVLIKAGEKIPVDGIIIEGSTSLDVSSLTGESLPKEVFVGDTILSGSININNVIKMKVLKKYEDSTVAKILDMVQNAANKKTKSEKFITKFAKYYTPIVVIIAVGLAIIPSIITKDWSVWIMRSLSFLVVSCPCALVISVPLSFFGGIGGASKCGILIKGTSYIELLEKANVFVFDKTGTLTKGNFKVEDIYIATSIEELYQLAYIVESSSNHPIARSIIKHIGTHHIDDMYDVEEVAGFGMIAKKESDIILAGSTKLMEKYDITYPIIKQTGTIIHIAKNNQYIGYFLIKDEIKEESKDVINYLNSNENKTIMLTGDNIEVAEEVKEKLNLTKCYASLLPQDKITKLEEIIETKDKNKMVVYIGDGINDAPVLVRADIGISMGNFGSDSAIEASDIVLMEDDLNGIKKAIKLSKKTMKIVRQNIVFAIGIKVAILILSACGITNIWLAIFADVGVCVLAILNAMRTMKFKIKK